MPARMRGLLVDATIIHFRSDVEVDHELKIRVRGKGTCQLLTIQYRFVEELN